MADVDDIVADTLRLCPVCRRAQPAAKTCRRCGQARPITLQQRPAAFLQDMRPGRGARSVQAVVATSALVLASLLLLSVLLYTGPFMVAAAVPLLLLPSLLRQSPVVLGNRLSTAAPWQLQLGDGQETIRGTVHPLEGLVEPHFTDGDVVATQLMVSRHGVRVLDAGRARDFWLVLDDGARVVVGGACEIRGETHKKVDRWDRYLAVDLPAGLEVDDHLRENVVRVGDRVEVRGIANDEVRSDIASYRESDIVRTIRGAPENPVTLHVLPSTA